MYKFYFAPFIKFSMHSIPLVTPITFISTVMNPFFYQHLVIASGFYFLKTVPHIMDLKLSSTIKTSCPNINRFVVLQFILFMLL